MAERHFRFSETWRPTSPQPFCRWRQRGAPANNTTPTCSILCEVLPPIFVLRDVPKKLIALVRNPLAVQGARVVERVHARSGEPALWIRYTSHTSPPRWEAGSSSRSSYSTALGPCSRRKDCLRLYSSRLTQATASGIAMDAVVRLRHECVRQVRTKLKTQHPKLRLLALHLPPFPTTKGLGTLCLGVLVQYSTPCVSNLKFP